MPNWKFDSKVRRISSPRPSKASKCQPTHQIPKAPKPAEGPVFSHHGLPDSQLLNSESLPLLSENSKHVVFRGGVDIVRGTQPGDVRRDLVISMACHEVHGIHGSTSAPEVRMKSRSSHPSDKELSLSSQPREPNPPLKSPCSAPRAQRTIHWLIHIEPRCLHILFHFHFQRCRSRASANELWTSA